MVCTPGNPLYVILPYFNFCGFRRRQNLFIEFVHRIARVRGIRVVVVECRGSAPLGRLPVWKHIRVDTECFIWIKENLVNIGVSVLPSCWRRVAWIDADLAFLNENWVDCTHDALDVYDIVQLFQTAIHLGPNGEPIKTDRSFGYMYRNGGKPYSKTDKYGFWHPGYAWACTRQAYEKMGGLLDWAILGSGDRHMALALIGHVEDSAPGNIHPSYKNLLIEFQNKIKTLQIGWVPGTIVHHWHGSLENRKYRERWDILTKLGYNPEVDIGYTRRGLIQLTPNGDRFQNEIKKYFQERCEDS